MEYKKISDLCNIKTGKYDANHAVENGEYYFYTCALEPSRANTYSFEGELVMLPGNGANLGEVMYFDGKIEAYQRTYVLHDIKCNSKYIFYYLKYMWKKYIFKRQVGSATNYMKLNDIALLEIPIPSTEEQERIVYILEKAEKAIQKREESNRLLDELVKSRFIKMFGDPISNPKSWEKIKVKDISNHLKRGKSPKYSDSSSINVINQKCIYWRDFKSENCKYYNEEFIDKIKGEFLDSGDIVINSTGTGTLGRALVLKNIKSNLYVADSHITVMKVNEFVNPIYITTLLEFKNIQSQLYAKCVNGSTNQIELSVSKLGNYKIMVPPIELQNEFADFVNQVEQMKFKMENSKKELENNFNSLMQKAFN